MTVVVLLHRHFCSDFALYSILSALSGIEHAQLWVSLTLCHMSTFCSTFLTELITSLVLNSDCLSLIFIWIPLGGVDFRFSLIWVSEAGCLYQQCNQSIHVTDGVTVTSLSASLLNKINVAMDHLCQITLNWKLLHKFAKWCKFSSRIKAKSCKQKLLTTRPACSTICSIGCVW
jgi:hypothetical protein